MCVAFARSLEPGTIGALPSLQVASTSTLAPLLSTILSTALDLDVDERADGRRGPDLAGRVRQLDAAQALRHAVAPAVEAVDARRRRGSS